MTALHSPPDGAGDFNGESRMLLKLERNLFISARPILRVFFLPRSAVPRAAISRLRELVDGGDGERSTKNDDGVDAEEV